MSTKTTQYAKMYAKSNFELNYINQIYFLLRIFYK